MKYYICVTELSHNDFATFINLQNIQFYNAILSYNDEEYGPGYIVSPYATPGTLYILHTNEEDCLMLSLQGIACIETDQIIFNNNVDHFKSFFLDRPAVDKIKVLAYATLSEENWLIGQLDKD